jgi:hypothetical protein
MVMFNKIIIAGWAAAVLLAAMPAWAGLTSNGGGWNGINVQGIDINGRSIQGVRIDGHRVQDPFTQGVSIHGTDVDNGSALQVIGLELPTSSR